MSSVISVRVTDEEKSILEEYSKALGVPVSIMLRIYTFKYLEDQLDFKVIKEYEKDLRGGKETLTP